MTSENESLSRQKLIRRHFRELCMVLFAANAALILVFCLVTDDYVKLYLFASKIVNAPFLGVYLLAMAFLFGVALLFSLGAKYSRRPCGDSVQAALLVGVGCAFLAILGHLNLLWASRGLAANIDSLVAEKLALDLSGKGGVIAFAYLHTISFAICGYLVFVVRPPRTKLFFVLKGLLCLLVVLLAARAILLERIVILEGVVAFFIFWFLTMKQSTVRLLFIVVPLFLVFVLGEAIRSWPDKVNANSSDTQNGFAIFAINRLGGYYISAINNGCALVDDRELGNTGGYFTFRGLLNTAGIGKLVPGPIQELRRHSNFWEEYLKEQKDLTPELNLFSGLGYMLLDWSWPGVLMFVVAGVVGGLAVIAVSKGKIWGIILLPVWVIAAMDVQRQFLFTNERFTLPLIVAACAVLLPRGKKSCL